MMFISNYIVEVQHCWVPKFILVFYKAGQNAPPFLWAKEYSAFIVILSEAKDPFSNSHPERM